MPEFLFVTITPAPSSGLPKFDAVVETKAPPGIWGPPGPWPSPPIAFPPGWIGGIPPGGWPEPPTPMPEPDMDWVYSGDGWYFIAGPYDKPKPICPTANLAMVDLPKAKWTTAGTGWYFVFGPFDKPRTICGVEPPDTEPPTEPPVDPGCKWTYTGAGWVLCCGPYDKPKPQTP